MKTKTISKSNWKYHHFHSRRFLIMSFQPSHQTDKKIDYQKTSNPYESRYGPDWRIEVKKLSFLRCYDCVRDMIEHVAIETKRVFKGTIHKKYFLFNQYALSLMTAKETRLRMTTVQFRRKNCTKMRMAQRKCILSYRSSCLSVIMWRGVLKNTGKLVMVFVVWRRWRKISEKKL